MKLFQKIVFSSLLVILSSFFFTTAHADTVDDFAYVLDKLDETGANPFKVNGSDIRASREMFYCIEKSDNDVEVVICIDTFHDTPLGQKAAEESEIPSWFWDLIEAYIDLRNEDYWPLVGKLGKAAICIVAQVLAEGTDVCGAIQSIIDAAHDLWDAGKAVAEFLESVGEGAVEVIEGAACEIGIGSCGESSSPEEIVYAWIFAPRIYEGVYARENVSDQAFGTLVENLRSNATHNPVMWSIDSLNRNELLSTYPPFPDHVVNFGENVYTRVVDAQWSANIVQEALHTLASKRNEYEREPNFSKAANNAVSRFIASGAVHRAAPAYSVTSACVEDFSQHYGFAHVDRWIGLYPQQATAVGNVQSNSRWCEKTFWSSNINNFAPHFYKAVKIHFCPEKNGQLQCPTVADMQACADLLGSVNKASQCKASMKLSKIAAQKIEDYFKKKGSKIPCKTREKKSAYPQIEYQCTRPAQQYHCKKANKLYFWSFPNPLLSCGLKTPSQYKKLVKKADKETRKINSKYNWKLVGNKLDPLAYINGPEGSIVNLPSDVREELEKKRNFSSPSASKGFVLQQITYSKRSDPVIPKIDGEDTPLIYFYWKNAAEKIREITKGLEKKYNLPGTGPLERDLTNPYINSIDTSRLQNERLLDVDKSKVKGINNKRVR